MLWLSGGRAGGASLEVPAIVSGKLGTDQATARFATVRRHRHREATVYGPLRLTLPSALGTHNGRRR